MNGCVQWKRDGKATSLSDSRAIIFLTLCVGLGFSWSRRKCLIILSNNKEKKEIYSKEIEALKDFFWDLEDQAWMLYKQK